jgi:hypothetical protein
LEPMSSRRWRICKEMERKIGNTKYARMQQQMLEQRRVDEQRARELQQQKYDRQQEVSRAAAEAAIMQSRKRHEGYPMPHPQLGRPRLKMLTCLYPQCRRVFATEFDLDNHLRAERQGAHVPRFHRSHHDFAISNGLTPEWIRSHHMVMCPSLVCAQHGQPFDTPDDLIYHFEQLGIESFWQPGWKPRAEVKEEEQKKNVGALASAAAADADVDKNVSDALDALHVANQPAAAVAAPAPAIIQIRVKEHFNVMREDDGTFSLCMCCFDNDPDLICLPCSHQVLCEDCFFKLNSATCPVCRAHIDIVIPTVL